MSLPMAEQKWGYSVRNIYYFSKPKEQNKEKSKDKIQIALSLKSQNIRKTVWNAEVIKYHSET